MGEAGVTELPVVSRAGGKQIGLLTTEDALHAYQALSRSKEREKAAGAPMPNWLAAVAAITVAAILIVSGLVFWQRSRRSHLAIEAQRSGQMLLAQGRVDEAVLAFRNGLAQTPQSTKLRAALGLALVQSGHPNEASSYLSEAARADPANGPVWMGLAKIALLEGEKKRALELFHQALAKEWPASEEPQRRRTQFDYAALLSDTGRRGEAISLLLAMIEQNGDDPAIGKKAADMVKAIATPEQSEEAYSMLAKRFPADSSVWLRLGDTRFAADKDRPALEAYRRAVKADPENTDAQRAVARVEDVLSLDPTRRGTSVGERARRWDEILRRMLTAVARCGQSPETEKAKPLLKKRAFTLEVSDQKMEAALRIWQSAAPSCKTDAVLSHIMSKLRE